MKLYALANTIALGILMAHVSSVSADAPPNSNLPPVDQDLAATAQGHGSISIGLQDTLVDGFRINNSIVDHAGFGTDRLRAVQIDLDYFIADKWSLHAGIPFGSNKYNGSEPHCPTTAPAVCQNNPNVPPLSPPHPESAFLDDGSYHGTWQDWILGVSYHANFGSYYLTPSFTAYIPSHNYVHFAEAAVGQDIWRVEPSLELAHQFDFSNIYYRLRYGYDYTQATHYTYSGISGSKRVNHHRLDVELGYFFNEKLSGRAFTIAKKGQGFTAMELGPLTEGFSNDLWFHHDQVSVHNYAAAGVGADYHLGGKYTLSASVQKLIWGVTVFDFKYSTEVRLTREF
jgi:hypothetical protein